MIIFLIVFLVVGLFLAVAPGGAVGYFFVAVSRRLSLAARIPLLVVLAAGTGAMWLTLMGGADYWRPIVVALSFISTLISGTVSLVHEAGKKRARNLPPVTWPGWYPPGAPR
ncbi:hypothetical protein PV721_24235 [Streptomyces sp. MB09-01]|uniref:hypothetical protein n=1 Tax=Streptomyces sp. MB09-01 TaxID=3028666 RepID=UPI0029BDE826|nr:hypothetical protein [Streptomyces sp. MB09-01]MDX3537421.1 hypothetical protein [Streptomyces sp. MB09-01]